MEYLIYILASISIILAIGGLASYIQSRAIGLLLSSIISIAFSVTAIITVAWWPLVVGFALNWILRLLGFDSSLNKQSNF